MNFVTDKQTLDDLNILGKYKNNSILGLFNHTRTFGGAKLLEKMFKQPLTNLEDINKRSSIFSFFGELNVSLPFNSKEFEVLENYLRTPESKNRLVAGFNITKSKLLKYITNVEEYPILCEGLENTIKILSELRTLFQEIGIASKNSPYQNEADIINEFLNNTQFDLVWQSLNEFPLPFQRVLQLDYILRGIFYAEMEIFLDNIYKLDVYITISKIARQKKYTYANALDKEEQIISIKQICHPCIDGAVPNDISIDGEKNVFFLTGANMAGKSTLMKSFGIAIYLAHMGFPVAAKSMIFSVHEGIYTSINVPDNLSKGYSHFYAEVLRVKNIACEVASNKQLVVIFDELFKGTNVKDASDGTVAVVDAFSKRRGSYIISTHIMEAGEILKSNSQLFYKFLPTIVKDNIPTYPYILEEGITDDRQGMMIIKNERVIDIINGKE
ncbi:MutS-related protein [Yeosuana marina]|uniref:MutS-related protein n=1 Tax=Yeosuana marina TaxID=1565536 RepID=UPI0030EC8233|tara:strand:- start:218 stop:1543 length:1326 start_codon:yes stop_codon:yes gene_type:complete